MGPSLKLDSICHDIEQAALPPVSIPEQRSKSWISAASWRIVNQKNSLWKLPSPTNHTAYRHLTRSLKASLREDRKKRATTADALAEAELNQDRIKEAWNVIHRSLIKVEDQPLPPSRENLRKVTTDCMTLYSKSLPPDMIPIIVAPFDIDDVVPEPDKIAQAVWGLKNEKSPGPSKVRAEHLKEWVREAYREDHPHQGNWNRVVDLIQSCFRKRQVPSQMSWSTVVLLPKGNGDYQGIGLLEMSWKVIESIINWRIASKVIFHDTLHGFWTGRGTGTAWFEAKLLQQLSKMVQKTLHFISLNLCKIYDTVNREQLLEILEGYGMGHNALGLLKFYWDNKRCVAKCGKHHGEIFVP